MNKNWEDEFKRHEFEEPQRILFTEECDSVEVEAMDYIAKLYKKRLGIKIDDKILDQVLTALESIPEVYNSDYKNHN